MGLLNKLNLFLFLFLSWEVSRNLGCGFMTIPSYRGFPRKYFDRALLQLHFKSNCFLGHQGGNGFLIFSRLLLEPLAEIHIGTTRNKHLGVKDTTDSNCFPSRNPALTKYTGKMQSAFQRNP